MKYVTNDSNLKNQESILHGQPSRALPIDFKKYSRVTLDHNYQFDSITQWFWAIRKNVALVTLYKHLKIKI